MKNNVSAILRWLAKSDKTLFEVSVEEQRVFLNSFQYPKDEIDRSYFQYLCQVFFIPWWKVLGLNLVALLLCPWVVLFFLLKKVIPIRKDVHCEAIGDLKGIEEVIPKELAQEFRLNNEVWFAGHFLSVLDLLFLYRLWIRHLFHPYFVFKIMVKVAGYSYMISCYRPKAIIVHNEYSFTSSVLTCYCHSLEVLHINVMHGEKLYYIRDSFFSYDRCYVWDNHYRELFISLRAESSQFRESIPSSLVVDGDKYRDDNCFADYKYYLAHYTESKLKSIVRSMSFAVKRGQKVRYRPHPRYSNLKLLEKVVGKDQIENPWQVSISKSIANSKFAVGSYSTVLSQAFFSGKTPMMDDVTFKEQYEQVRERDYFLTSKEYLKLSEYQK